MSRCYNRAVGGKNELVLTNEPMVLSRLTNEPGCLGYEPVHTNDLGGNKDEPVLTNEQVVCNHQLTLNTPGLFVSYQIEKEQRWRAGLEESWYGTVKKPFYLYPRNLAKCRFCFPLI